MSRGSLVRRKIAKNLKDKDKVLSCVFLEANEVRGLNKKYRELDRPTDVLSFEPLLKEGYLGELVFCVPLVQQQARENRHSYREELAYLSLHGLLHLLGFEHEGGGAEAERMYQIQDSLFSAIKSFRLGVRG